MAKDRTGGRDDWRARMRTAKAIWSRIRPDEKPSRGYVASREFIFHAERGLGNEVSVGVGIRCWQIGEGAFSLRSRCLLFDRRVSDLRSRIEGRETSDLQVLDFDVLAASCVLSGRELQVSQEVSVAEYHKRIEGVLRVTGNMLDQVWRHFGGYERAALERLGLWALKQREGVGLGFNPIGAVFAAATYGSRELARQYLNGWEAQWAARARTEADNPAVQDVRDDVRGRAEAIRQILFAS